jgi:RimJ/RimL family protein N-acetyltransferase
MLLETPRLCLRRFQPEDTAAFAAYRSDPVIARYQSWTAPLSVESAASLVRRLAGGEPGQPGWFQYAVELKADRCLAGDVGVNLHENRMQAEIGFTLAAGRQGHGYATEAVCALLRDLFERRGLHPRFCRMRCPQPQLGAAPGTGGLPAGGAAPRFHLDQGRVD